MQKNKETLHCNPSLYQKKQVHTRNDTKVLLTIDIHDDLICMRNASKIIFVYFLFRFYDMFFYKNIYSPLF